MREGGRIVSVAAIVAAAVDAEGRREIVGLHIGPSEAEVFWTDFLRSSVKRGLSGVQLVIPDAHDGLKAADARDRVGSLKLPGLVIKWSNAPDTDPLPSHRSAIRSLNPPSRRAPHP